MFIPHGVDLEVPSSSSDVETRASNVENSGQLVADCMEEALLQLAQRGLPDKALGDCRIALRKMFLDPLAASSDRTLSPERRLVRQALLGQGVRAAVLVVESDGPSVAKDAAKKLLSSLKVFGLAAYDSGKKWGMGAAVLLVLERLAEQMQLVLGMEKREIVLHRLQLLLELCEQSRADALKRPGIEEKDLREFSARMAALIHGEPLLEFVHRTDPGLFQVCMRRIESKLSAFAEECSAEKKRALEVQVAGQLLKAPIRLKRLRIDGVDSSCIEEQSVMREYSEREGDYSVAFVNLDREQEETRVAKKNLELMIEAQAYGAFGKSISLGDVALVGSHFKNDKLVRRNSYVRLGQEQDSHFVMPQLFGQSKLGPSIEKVDYITGSCLWSSGTAQARTADGKLVTLVDPKRPIREKIVNLELDEVMTVYETDTINRLSGVIASLGTENSPARKVFLSIPKTEYKLYLFEALRDGHMSLELFAKWCREVELRHVRVKELLCAKLPAHLSKIVLDPLQPLEPLVEEILGGNLQAGDAALKAAKNILSAASPLWAEALRIHTKGGGDISWADLAYISYALAELTAADISEEKGKLCVAVDNRHEVRIFERAEKLNAILKVPVRLLVLISHELVQVKQGTRQWFDNLYFFSGKQSAELANRL